MRAILVGSNSRRLHVLGNLYSFVSNLRPSKLLDASIDTSLIDIGAK